jgi:signal peptidase II
MDSIKSKSGIWWLWISAIVVILDQWTKAVATSSLDLYHPIKVNLYLNWTLMHNEGVAFSILADQSGWQRWFISVVAIAIVIWLLYWLKQNLFKMKLLNSGLAFVIGGALGNIYDRLSLGYVIDFIEAHYNDNYWPAFNIADMAISFGAFLLILDLFFTKSEDDAKKIKNKENKNEN